MKKYRSTFHVPRFVFSLVLALWSLCFATRAATLSEDFSSNPLQNGWGIFGDTDLFHWDSTNHSLAVTWDSSQSNSYFYHPLGTTLTMADNFTVDFDLNLQDIQWSGTFQISIGLLNFTNAIDPNFSRGGGTSPNFFEFDYFPDSGDSHHDPSVDATMTDATAESTDFPDFYFVFDNQSLQTNVTYHVRLNHNAGEATITGLILTNGQIFTAMPNVGNNFGEIIGPFALDTVSVISYSGAGQDPDFFGTILAHGSVDNIAVTLPPVVRNFAGAFTNNLWQVQFGNYSNWNYTLQRSTNLTVWDDASATVPGTGNAMTISDTNAVDSRAFYRIHAQQP